MNLEGTPIKAGTDLSRAIEHIRAQTQENLKRAMSGVVNSWMHILFSKLRAYTV